MAGQEYLLAMAVALVVILLTFLGTRLRRRSRGDAVLILGNMNTGKTALLYTLMQDRFPETHTSMKENVLTFIPPSLPQVMKHLFRFVDLPGHGSHRAKLEGYLNAARAVIFMVDSSDDMSYQSVASYLYSVLASARVTRNRIPVLVACNKADVDTAKSVNYIRGHLETQLDKCRSAQSSLLTLGEKEGRAAINLGRPGVPFKFEHSAAPVSLASISVAQKEIAPVLDFIAKL